MDSEAKPVVDNMTGKRETSVHGRKVVYGKICGVDTAVVVCGVGKVNAAAATEYAINCLGADKIINTGVAGGLNKSTAVGEIYEIYRAVQYDFDLVDLNGTPMGTLNEYDEPYLGVNTVGAYPLKSLGTGDRFNDSRADFLLLTDELNADIRDMEGGAIAHVCKHAGVPFYSFKAISDVAGNGATPEQFNKNLQVCVKALGENTEKFFTAVLNG